MDPVEKQRPTRAPSSTDGPPRNESDDRGCEHRGDYPTDFERPRPAWREDGHGDEQPGGCRQSEGKDGQRA
jgi:hypothetical protein